MDGGNQALLKGDFWTVLFCCSYSLLDANFHGMARKFLGIEFVDLLHTPLERRLQTIAICCYLFLFLCCPILCLAITAWLCFTRLYFIPLLYAVWFVYDFRTPERGGRRCEWVRNWKLWQYCRDYFPLTLHSTASLDANRNYLLICHPHGIMAFSGILCSATNATDFSRLFSGVQFSAVVLKWRFMYPFYREYFMSHGKWSVLLLISLRMS